MYDHPTSQSENKIPRGPSYLNAVSIKAAWYTVNGHADTGSRLQDSWRAELEKESFPWLKELTLSNSVLF